MISILWNQFVFCSGPPVITPPVQHKQPVFLSPCWILDFLFDSTGYGMDKVFSYRAHSSHVKPKLPSSLFRFESVGESWSMTMVLPTEVEPTFFIFGSRSLRCYVCYIWDSKVSTFFWLLNSKIFAACLLWNYGGHVASHCQLTEQSFQTCTGWRTTS